MGCGPSHDSQNGQLDAKTPRPSPNQKSANGVVNNHNKNKVAPDPNANSRDVSTKNPVPKPVAFSVGLDGEEKESLIWKHPPLKLKKLEPLNVPTMTPEMLAEKQRLADEKREKERQRKVSASRKSSKRRKDLMMAREFEKQQMEKMQEQEEQKLKSAEMLREARLNDIKEKQRLREERAKRAREKAKRMSLAEQNELENIDVEKDDHYNADDADSWLGDDNDLNQDDRIYSGRSSPSKGVRNDTRYPSASTVDSYDNAFNRKPPSASAPRQSQVKEEQDDFFDS